MKKIFLLFTALFSFAVSAQETANRFFYEMNYKASKENDSIKTAMTILDVTPSKSIFRDYLTVSQDSILKEKVEQMMKSGDVSGIFELSKTMKKPKFSYKVSKTYPEMEVKYGDYILQDEIYYLEKVPFHWKVLPEKAKIGEYDAQKATTSFGGRNWVAWFSSEIPFQDGPYKFHGLPGLIVKIEDDKKEYSWELKGNKKVENYSEMSYTESLALQNQIGKKKMGLEVTRPKFEKLYEDYRKDPMGSIRGQLSQVPADFKMPDGTPFYKMVKEQEQQLKKYLNENNNPIELTSPKTK